MENKKTKKSDSEKPVRKKKSEKESSEEREPMDEREIGEMLEDEMLGELDEEDDDEFIHKVEEAMFVDSSWETVPAEKVTDDDQLINDSKNDNLAVNLPDEKNQQLNLLVQKTLLKT